jgi:hypothetical protein
MIMQVQSIHIMSKLTSVQESAPTFANFAQPMGAFNLEVLPPWSGSSDSSRRLSEQGDGKDRQALRMFAGHAFYVLLIFGLGSALHFGAEKYLSSQKPRHHTGGWLLQILLQVFMFPQPEVLFALLMYQGACALSSRAIVAAIKLQEWGQFIFAFSYFVAYPFAWFVYVAWHMLILVPSKRTAAFDAVKREWAESEDESASLRNHTYVKRWGTLFTSYNGIRLAQIFVMLTMTQQMLIGGCTGFMAAGGSATLATAQVVLVTLFANVGFGAFAYLRPLVQTSKLKMHIYNADGCIKAGKRLIECRSCATSI